MRPLIGVTSSSDDDGRPAARPAYLLAVQQAGGLPVALPFVESAGEAHELLARLDGVLLSGSDDLHSSLWGEPLHPAAKLMHSHRQRTELLLCEALLASDLPLLGICGGMQTLAVAAGGSLHQHVPDLGPHVLDHAAGADGPRHDVTVEPGTRLAALLGGRAAVNTAHHQAIARLPAGFLPAARAPDGVLEAWEMPSRRFAVGVQWHPERMPDDPGQRRLLAALVAAARAASYP